MTTITGRFTATARLLPTVALVAAVTVGCATAEASPTCPTPSTAPTGLVLVVGTHQNVQAPGVPEALGCALKATIAARQPVVVVGVDGTPEVLLSTSFPVSDANPDATADDITAAVNTVVATVADAAADADGSDLLAGISMGADQARAAGAPNAHLAVIDSGLPDTGSLDMTAPGMLAADPAQVADFLQAQGALPDLGGFSIELVGFGYSTTPQAPLPQAAQSTTIGIWTTLAERAGAASVAITPVVRTGEGPDTPHTTRTAPIPEPPRPPINGETAVYDDTSALGFLPDSTTLRDPAAAAQALTDLAAWLAADPTRTAHIEGTTASAGTPDGRTHLSAARAETIRTLLVHLGANPDRITTHGAGYTATPPDRAPDGTLNPAAATLNRTVHITTSAS